MFKINMFSPDFIIECDKLKTSDEIYTVMHSYNRVKNYVYAICYRNGLRFEVIKFGESAPSPGTNTSKAIGERIKRQLEHVPGWSYDPHHFSSHGDDFWSNLQREIKEGNIPNLNKDNLTIGIWNIDKRIAAGIPYLYRTNRELTTWAEGELTEQHKKFYGKKPILNIKDPTRNKSFKGPLLPTTLFSYK